MSKHELKVHKRAKHAVKYGAVYKVGHTPAGVLPAVK